MLGISHELRTPLSRLRIATELIDSPDDCESLRAEVTEMDKIVGTLLEAERLNEKHAPLTRSFVRVGDLVDDMIDNYFDRDRQRLQLDIRAADLDINVDEARLMLCLKNLISNALRYSPEDPLCIRAHMFGSRMASAAESLSMR